MKKNVKLMKKNAKLTFEELPSVICERFLDGSVTYFVLFKGVEIFVTSEYESLYSFLQGFYIGLGYPPHSSDFFISLRDKMEFKF